MFCLARIFLDVAPEVLSVKAPVAHLTPLPWCGTEGADLIDPGDVRAGIRLLLVVVMAVSWAI